MRQRTLASLPQRKEESVSNVTQAGLNVAFVGQSIIQATNPDLCSPRPLLSCCCYARERSQDADKDDLFYTPFPQCLYGGNSGATSRDNRINNDGELRDSGLRLRQVIVILDWLQRELLAEETEMVYGDGVREESLDG